MVRLQVGHAACQWWNYPILWSIGLRALQFGSLASNTTPSKLVCVSCMVILSSCRGLIGAVGPWVKLNGPIPLVETSSSCFGISRRDTNPCGRPTSRRSALRTQIIMHSQGHGSLPDRFRCPVMFSSAQSHLKFEERRVDLCTGMGRHTTVARGTEFEQIHIYLNLEHPSAPACIPAYSTK